MNGKRDFDLDLRIDELALHGFEQMDRTELGTAVERALGQLFAQRGLPSSLSRGGHVESLDGGRFAASPGTSVQEIGGQIARGIYRGFGS